MDGSQWLGSSAFAGVSSTWEILTLADILDPDLQEVQQCSSFSCLRAQAYRGVRCIPTPLSLHAAAAAAAVDVQMLLS